MQANAETHTLLRFSTPAWGLAIALAVVAAMFYPAVDRMVDVWLSREEYSHGVLIPLIALFLVWQRKDAIERMEFTGSWAGVALIVAGGLLHARRHRSRRST